MRHHRLRRGGPWNRTFSLATAFGVAGAVMISAGTGTARADLEVGPGPTNYTEQTQPAPGSCHYRSAANGAILPDQNCTPGAVNPKVTQDTLDTTICRGGYSKSIRPPHAITDAEKRANAESYSYTGGLGSAEFDHLVALSLGGDPNDPANLWVEPQQSPNPKDRIEDKLHQAVCYGRVPLSAAQHALATDWTTALDILG